jgi:hypothetical protein
LFVFSRGIAPDSYRCAGHQKHVVDFRIRLERIAENHGWQDRGNTNDVACKPIRIGPCRPIQLQSGKMCAAESPEIGRPARVWKLPDNPI